MSVVTTDLGPRLSATTQPGHEETRAKVDFTEASLAIRGSTSEATSGAAGAFIEGELYVASVAASTASLIFRSGNTLFVFSSDLTAITI